MRLLLHGHPRAYRHYNFMERTYEYARNLSYFVEHSPPALSVEGARQQDEEAIESGWRRLGGGNTAGVGASVMDTTGGARGGTETGFEFAFTFMAMGDSNLTIFLWQTMNTKTLFPMRRRFRRRKRHVAYSRVRLRGATRQVSTHRRY